LESDGKYTSRRETEPQLRDMLGLHIVSSFNLYSDIIFNKTLDTDIGININGLLPIKNLRYADDTVIMAGGGAPTT